MSDQTCELGDLPVEIPASIAGAGIDSNINPSLLTLPIKGMNCTSCSGRVEKALIAAPGVSGASVNLAMERADIQFDSALTNSGTLRDVVITAGYEVPVPTVMLDVTGMTCGGCASRVEKALRTVPGVVDARVNAATDRADVDWLGEGNADLLIAAIESTGYNAELRLGAGARRKEQQLQKAEEQTAASRREWTIFAIAVAFTAPLVLQMILHMAGLGVRMPGWAEFALATPVQFWIGARFYKGAWNAIKAGAGNMDVLVAMGTSAAYFYSVYNLWKLGDAASGHLYFEAAAVIITSDPVRKNSRISRQAWHYHSHT